MRYIKLTQGKRCAVDEEDYEELSQYKWQFGANGYAVRDEYLGKIDGKYAHRTVLMHRQLISPPNGVDVDHINQDKLDNRRSNLREATRSQNRANVTKAIRKNGLPTGVSFNQSVRGKQPYAARVTKGGITRFLGNFYTIDEAVEAYRTAKVKLFGDYSDVK